LACPGDERRIIRIRNCTAAEEPMRRLAAVLLPLLLAGAAPALAKEPSVTIAVKGQQFVPDEVEIPAHTRVKLIIRNEDKIPAEFESSELHREKVVPGGGKISLFVGPLKPGRYEFFDDFHPSSRGHLVVK
jgi:Cupredoxin-like domain